MGSDANSLNVNPYYISSTDLNINQANLESAGQSVTGFDVDFLQTVRPNPPTIGAVEYTPCPDDASIASIVSPSVPLSGPTNDVVVSLSNQGTNVLTAASIAWAVNGVTQTPYNWSGTLSSNGTTNVTLASSYTLSGASIYDISAWVETVNGLVDCNNYNDTAKVEDLVSQLCGTYTIGGNSPDFVDFSEAATVLNNAGITCPVVFSVRDGVYDGQVLFCLLYTSPSPRDATLSRMPSSA